MGRWNLIKRWSAVALFVVLISVIYYSGNREVWAATPKPTYGSILVDSPEVYTRERLVNDRFRQDEWLRKRLDATDSMSFGIQGSLAEQKTKGTSFGAQLNTTPGGKPLVAKEQPDSQGKAPGLPPVNVSPIDHFRDLLAYREEVRNEIIQNQLDDRHDLDGNTLYRCKFDVTLVPGPQTRASAIVQVSVKGSFGTLEYEPSDSAMPSGGSLELAQLDHPDYAPSMGAFRQTIDNIRRIHGQGGLDSRTLKSLDRAFEQWQDHMVQDLQKESNGFDGVLTEKDRKDVDLRHQIISSVELGLYWASDYQDQSAITDGIDAYFAAAAQSSESNADVRSVDDYLKLLEDVESDSNLRQGLLIRDPSYVPDGEALVKYLLNQRKLQPIVDKASTYFSIALPSAQDSQCRISELEFQVQSYGLPLKDDPEDESQAAYDQRVLAHNQAEEANFERLVDEIKTALGDAFETTPFLRVDRQSKTLSIRLGFLSFVERLRANKASVYTYAVTPRESAQRISSLSEGRDSLQTVIGLSALAGGTGLDTSISQLNQRDAQIGAIERQPLVVGFVGGNSADEGVFGWVLGPRFEVAERPDGGVSFRHVPAQHSLAAILSAPAWWPEMEVSIRTYWLDEEGRQLDARGEIIESVRDGEANDSVPPDNVWTVSLPAGAQDLSELLIGGADTRAKKPDIEFEKDAKVHLTAGTKASILIPGYHLWRSTVVTLGGETATGITVLPNMNGIIATFETIPTPPDWQFDESKPSTEQPYKDLKLTVWTSEGTDAVEDVVYLYRKPKEEAEE